MAHLNITDPTPSSHTSFLCRTFRILSNTLRRTCQVLRILLRYLFWSFPFNASLVKIYPAYLRGTHAHKEEVHSSQTIIMSAIAREDIHWRRRKSYSRFLGLMTKHHRVQIAPVAIRARFCESDRLSAGRVKSLAPARARHHYTQSLIIILISVPTIRPICPSDAPS